MRIWSIHPKYLDTKGLVALWRETLLAKNVLEGRTKGYKNHPQLLRFKEANNPLQCIHQYLEGVYLESLKRGYRFNKSKFEAQPQKETLSVCQGQVDYEIRHLLKKLKTRDYARYEKLRDEKKMAVHPLFTIVEGGIEAWELI